MRQQQFHKHGGSEYGSKDPIPQEPHWRANLHAEREKETKEKAYQMREEYLNKEPLLQEKKILIEKLICIQKP